MVIYKFDEEQDPPPAYDNDEEYDLYLYIPSISSRLIPVEGTPEISLEVDNYEAIGPENSSNILPPYQLLLSDVGTQTVGRVVERDVDFPCLHVRASFILFAPC
jgi:hypothetical protein